ncbi:MAG: hypothetical protein D8M57_00825 [Candidatus Scalindua sp. AMX11]|nr:MAG: hypothetical protein DWQ00_18155 [Candidatus Scalindua sp.]NOG86081.1 hypothetical protein [Planctomycetota bacterium]RZV98848.1 MAG: hypothetical protein EX341_00080 [Candidatus Scalindua sp. SCAELEC01]TDE66961.1 MAG: hypothetical protein D8M57_00825 [Candidatus Scalindua sp. AMX11]GJQ57769.1 MAG: hypothetical protein SCALA701_05700 [Candidatus Scalindua sp.]
MFEKIKRVTGVKDSSEILFLFSGNHVLKDIPNEIQEEGTKYPDVEFYYSKNIGVDFRIAQIVADRVDTAIDAQ